MGSGKRLKQAIIKHGIENFHKDILEFFADEESMYARERDLVTEDFIMQTDTYNLRVGGSGGFTHKEASNGRIQANKQLKQLYGNEWRTVIGRRGIAAQRERQTGIYAPNYISQFTANPVIQQLGNSPEARAKARISQRKTFATTQHQQGAKNSQYGTCWIWFEGIGNKKCKQDLLPLYIDQGWLKGRRNVR